jgi:chemotaxis-related protein WspD
MLRLLDRPISDSQLAAGAESTARPSECRSAGAVLGLLVFRLGDERLALPAKILRGVTPHADPIRVPHKSGRLLRGLCNIRGELVLCADLRGMLGIPCPPQRAADEERPDERRMVMINAPDGAWAFEVDAVEGVQRTASEAMAPAPVTVKYAMAGCTAGVATIKEGGVTVLDGERVVSGFQAGLT